MSNTDTVHTSENSGMQSSGPRNRIVHAALLVVGFTAGCATSADPDETSVATSAAAVENQPDTSSAHRPAHCVAPWGIDWSDVLHVKKAAIVSPFCTEVQAGDPYIPEVKWITNTEDGIEGLPLVYPAGYTPRHDEPTKDFLHKLERVRYVVHPGEQELSFRGSQIKKGLTLGDLYEGSTEFPPEQMVLPATSLLGELPSLPPGTYSADIHLVMSDMHCDGQTTDAAASCLPAGDSLALTRNFVVLP
jgi:hypothetical protein